MTEVGVVVGAGRFEHGGDGLGADAPDPTGTGVELLGVLLRDFELARAVRYRTDVMQTDEFGGVAF